MIHVSGKVSLEHLLLSWYTSTESINQYKEEENEGEIKCFYGEPSLAQAELETLHLGGLEGWTKQQRHPAMRRRPARPFRTFQVPGVVLGPNPRSLEPCSDYFQGLGRGKMVEKEGGRRAARAEDAQGTPTQSHISPSILVNDDKMVEQEGGRGYRPCAIECI